MFNLSLALCCSNDALVASITCCWKGVINGSRAAVNPAAVVCPVAGSIPASLCDSVTNGSKLATPVPVPTPLTVPFGPPKVTAPSPADVAACCNACCCNLFCAATSGANFDVSTAAPGANTFSKSVKNTLPADSIKGAGKAISVLTSPKLPADVPV